MHWSGEITLAGVATIGSFALNLYNTFSKLDQGKVDGGKMRAGIKKWSWPISFAVLTSLYIHLWWTKPSSTGELTGDQKEMLQSFHQEYPNFAERSVASQQDLSSPVVSSKVVFILDVPRGPNNKSLIEGKRFENCAILGPCILGLLSDNEFKGIVFSAPGGTGINSILYEVSDEPHWGTIATRSTSFVNCTFFQVGLMGNKLYLDNIRQEVNRHH
jgi:hypothetical protein